MSDQEVTETADDDASEPDDLVARVAAHDESLAEAVERLRERADGLADDLEATRAEVDELTSRLKRVHADFDNYKKRVERREEELRERATERLVERLLSVRDDLQRAVEAEAQAVEDLREGVRMTLGELDRVLDAEGVAAIAPDPGEAVDPRRHEVMMRVDSEHPAETIAEVFEPGYAQGDRVLRPAKVTVSDGPESEE
ncbi:MAG: nucleotide exchange factor GrpE [Halobacteriales archaeon]